jgi:hypothetical protein
MEIKKDFEQKSFKKFCGHEATWALPIHLGDLTPYLTYHPQGVDGFDMFLVHVLYNENKGDST